MRTSFPELCDTTRPVFLFSAILAAAVFGVQRTGRSMSITQYVRFLVVGGVVGLITVGSRELIGRLLAADTAFYYSVSVVLAYVIGITLSFLANHRFTFGGDTASRDWRKFLLFTAIALVGMASTWLLALLLRYGAHLDSIAGRFSPTLAFAVATLLSSLISYPLNALLVFRKRSNPTL